MHQIGERIKKERKKRGISQRNLANRINISHTTIARIEKGETKPDASTTIALADFFQVSTDYILGRTDTRPEAIKPKEIFKSPYKETQTFKNIVKIIDRLTLDELQMVNGVITAIVGDTTKDKKAE